MLLTLHLFIQENVIAFGIIFKHSSLTGDFLLVLNVILVLHGGYNTPDLGLLVSPRKSISAL